jgi:SAM-dependent methyltransferase
LISDDALGLEMTTGKGTYAFDNELAVQCRRLRTLEALLDDGTFGLLEARGVAPGWRCLEVGAGGGSVASWLCRRVGPTGVVVATDLKTTLLQELTHTNLELRVHDVIEDELPEGDFDLVHLRLLLGWLSDPLDALKRLVLGLKPGGWLVAEEMDFVSVAVDPRLNDDERALFTRVVDAHNAVLTEEHAFDPFYGRRLACDLSKAGLTEIDSAGRVSMWSGGQLGGLLWRLTFAQLREAMIRAGEVTAADIDTVMALCDDPRLNLMSQVTMAAWGRHQARPGA